MRTAVPGVAEPGKYQTTPPTIRKPGEVYTRLDFRYHKARGLLRGPRPVHDPLGARARDYSSQMDTRRPVVLAVVIVQVPQISFSSPRSTTPYLPTPEGHRERVLSLSQALATEASQWHRMMTGEARLGALGSGRPGILGPGGEESEPAGNPLSRRGKSWTRLGSSGSQTRGDRVQDSAWEEGSRGWAA